MSSIPLSEQLGAMALVDELRHQQRETEEHLSLPQRRAEVATRIREYYQKNAIEFDEALIDQGVRAFFSRRLVFEAPELGPLDRLLSKQLLNRRRWIRAAQFVAIALLAVQCTRVMQDNRETTKVENAVSELKAATAGQLAELTQYKERLAQLQQQLAQHPEPAAERLLSGVSGLLAQAEPLLAPVAFTSTIDASNRDSVLSTLPGLRERADKAAPLLQKSATALNDSSAILDSAAQLRQLQQDPVFTKATPRFKALSYQATNAQQALAYADSQGLEAANQQVTALATLIEKYRPFAASIDELETLIRQAAQLKLSAEDAKELNFYVHQVSTSIDKFNLSDTQYFLQNYRNVIYLFPQALTLRVVDRVGVKSGVERCYDQALCNSNPGSTQGKSWYLIVEGVNDDGVTVAIPILSSETGMSNWTKQFGVRVSQAEYLKVKADKLDDGRLSNRAMGDKTRNELALNFNKRALRPFDTIVDW